MPKVQATIEDKSIEAWVDLGRSIALFQEDQLPSGLLTPTGVTLNTQGFNDTLKRQPEYKIPSIQLGEQKFTNVKGTVGTSQIPSYTIKTEETSIENKPSPPLMLGNEIFNDGVLLVDYKEGYFAYGKDLSEFNQIPYRKWASVNFEIDRGQIQFLALSKGQNGHWILDSGASINMIYKTLRGDLKFTKMEDQPITFGHDSFVLDHLYYTNKPIKSGVSGVLGAPFLKNNRVLIDFHKHHLYIEP